MAQDVIALTLTFFLGGGLLGIVVFPEPVGVGTRLLLSWALAVPATLLAGLPGLALHDLAAWNVLLGFAVLAACAAIRWRSKPARAADHAPREIMGTSKPLRRRQRVAQVAVVTVVALATWVTVFVPENVNKVETGRPNGTIVYYHWGIVGRVVDAGGLPATLNEWGQPREFPYEYAFSVMHAASTAVLAGTADFRLEERYRIAMVASCFLAAFALWRRWLPAWWAWLAAVLTLSVSRIETRMLVYKPEAFAFILVLWSTWLLDQALERRSRRWGVMAGIVLACSFLAHPIGSLLAAPVWGGVLLGRVLAPVLVERGRTTRAAIARATRELTQIAKVAAPAIAVFAVLFIAGRSIVGSTGQDLEQSPVAGVDETRVVYNLAYVSSDPLAHPNVPEAGDLFGVYSTVRPFFSRHARWFYFDIHSPSSVLLIAGLIAILAGGLASSLGSGRAWPTRVTRGLITWLSYGAGVCVLAVLIGAVYHTWVPQRIAPMRLMPYWSLVFPGFLAAIAWAGALGLSRGMRAAGIRSPFPASTELLGKRVRMIPALLVSAIALWTFSSQLGGRDPGISPFFTAETRVGGVSPDAFEAYTWMRHHLPADSVILANGYTEGALGMVSDRTGLLDGRTPFSQPDPWRAEAISWLEAARAFFQEPNQHPIPPQASYVLVAPDNVNLGGSYFPTNFPQLTHSNRLKLVQRFGRILLFRVIQPRSPATLRRTT